MSRLVVLGWELLEEVARVSAMIAHWRAAAAPIGSSIGAAHEGCVVIGFSSERSAGRWGAAAQPVVIR